MRFPKTRLLIAALVVVLGSVACDTAEDGDDTLPVVNDTTTTTPLDTTTTTGG